MTPVRSWPSLMALAHRPLRRESRGVNKFSLSMLHLDAGASYLLSPALWVVSMIAFVTNSTKFKKIKKKKRTFVHK